MDNQYKKLMRFINYKTKYHKKIFADVINPISILNYKYLVKTRIINGKQILVWTDAFNKALSENERIYIPKNIDNYYLDGSIIVSDNKMIIADERAKIILIEECKSLLLRNKNVYDGSNKPIPPNTKNKNIWIEGGIWSTTATKRAKYGNTCCFDSEDSKHGVYTLMLFSNVQNLVLKNLVIEKASGFSIQIGEVENFNIENIKFQNCFADGVHINGKVKNGKIKNIIGECGDDLIALNAYDWDNSTINFGYIENIIIDNVVSLEGQIKTMRLQAGIYPYENGQTEDCYLNNIIIKNVKNIGVFKMYLQTPAYQYSVGPERNIGVGKIKNIYFNNIKVDATSPMDRQPNYLYSREVVGCFGAFEFGSNIENIFFNKVSIKLDKEKYPYSYFITIGPKTQYLPEYKVELFDPYIYCEAKNIFCKNVKINGKDLEDDGKYIKEIDFNNISEFVYGKGKLINKIIIKND